MPLVSGFIKRLRFLSNSICHSPPAFPPLDPLNLLSPGSVIPNRLAGRAGDKCADTEQDIKCTLEQKGNWLGRGQLGTWDTVSIGEMTLRN